MNMSNIILTYVCIWHYAKMFALDIKLITYCRLHNQNVWLQLLHYAWFLSWNQVLTMMRARQLEIASLIMPLFMLCRSSSSAGTARRISQSVDSSTRSPAAARHWAHHAYLQESTVSGARRSVSDLQYYRGFLYCIHRTLYRSETSVLSRLSMASYLN